jgi:hypothetical protein
MGFVTVDNDLVIPSLLCAKRRRSWKLSAKLWVMTRHPIDAQGS